MLYYRDLYGSCIIESLRKWSPAAWLWMLHHFLNSSSRVRHMLTRTNWNHDQGILPSVHVETISSAFVSILCHVKSRHLALESLWSSRTSTLTTFAGCLDYCYVNSHLLNFISYSEMNPIYRELVFFFFLWCVFKRCLGLIWSITVTRHSLA